MTPQLMSLASYREFCDAIGAQWPRFLRKRTEWLLHEVRYGHASEKVAESILADFFTVLLHPKYTRPGESGA